MSDMKMSDVFNLPMFDAQDSTIISNDYRHVITFDESDSNAKDQARAVCDAINTNDQHIARIAELECGLRDAVNALSGDTVCECLLHCECSSKRIGKLNKLLEQSR